VLWLASLCLCIALTGCKQISKVRALDGMTASKDVPSSREHAPLAQWPVQQASDEVVVSDQLETPPEPTRVRLPDPVDAPPAAAESAEIAPMPLGQPNGNKPEKTPLPVEKPDKPEKGESVPPLVENTVKPREIAPPVEKPVQPESLPPPPEPPDLQKTKRISSQSKKPDRSEPEVIPLPQAMLAPRWPESSHSQAGPSAAEKKPFTLSLHSDALDVRKVLEILSREAKVNILVSPKVTGKVTLDIQDKTLEEVLDAIAKLCRVAIQREKDIIYVTTIDERRQSQEDTLPVHVYHLNYVRSKDVEEMIKPLLSTKGKIGKSPEAEMGLKSDFSGGSANLGQGDVKAGGNTLAGGETLVVQDYEDRLKTIDRVIAEFDVQPIQVLIEAVIVSVALNKNMELGVNFAVLDGAKKTLGVAGNGSLVNMAAGFTPASVITSAGKLAGDAGAGFAENANGIKFGWTGGDTTAFLRALESLGETKVLAAPRLLVLNRQRAQIHLGQKLGYETTITSQTNTSTQVQFMDIGTQLRLRPFVSSDGMVRMEIVPERSTRKLDAAGIPQTHTAQVTSNVMIPDGTTIVIGGLMDTEVTHDWEGIPLLSRLPMLGYLFRYTHDETVKKELIVILTPHIIRNDAPAAGNSLGRPNALGLDRRVSQKPCEENRDGPGLYELLTPSAACPVIVE